MGEVPQSNQRLDVEQVHDHGENLFIIYHVSNFMFSCILLDESASCESNEIQLFPGNSSESFILVFFVFFDTWYIIKYLLTRTFGKKYVLW
jgi:hypothetical protein